MRGWIFGVAACAAVAAVAPAQAANNILVSYYTVTTGGDFGSPGASCCSTTSNLVLGALGPNGLPVFNPANSAGLTLTDIDAMTGELKWWTPNGTHVVSTGSGIIPLPFNDTSFFIPNGTGGDNASGYQSARLDGIARRATAGIASFTIHGDDDVFVFINGQSVAQLGGIHPDNSLTFNANLNAGDNIINLFFADRFRVAAALGFDVNSNDVTVSAVPEPASWAMMIGGFGLVGSAMRRRRAGNVKVAFA